jgi:hypothetical protein
MLAHSHGPRRAFATSRARTLIAIGAALTALCDASRSSAQPLVEARARAAVYHDSDFTTVTTLGARGLLELPDLVRVTGAYLADVVSTASVDVVSAATGRWHETRHEATGEVTAFIEDLALSGAYRYSIENDWKSHTIGAGAVLGLFEKNTELGVSGTLALNQVGRASDATFSEELDSHGYEITASQLLDPRTIIALAYSGSYNLGFQSSPYRFVSTSDRRFTFLERHPDARLRHAAAVELTRYLFAQTSGSAKYRFYADDWGVVGYTGELRLMSDVSEFLSVAVRERVYLQKGASFYRSSYDQPRRYMSVDRELSTFWDSFSGAELLLELDRVGPFRRIGADVSFDFFYFSFQDYPLLDQRTGVFVAGGLMGAL